MKWELHDKYNKKFSVKRLFKSFRYASQGVFKAYQSEENLWVHTIVTLLVIALSFYFKISKLEFSIVILAIGLVVSVELINTAIEYTVDMAMPNIHPLAKIAKDVAAGAVLISAITAIIVGLIIFVPYIVKLF